MKSKFFFTTGFALSLLCAACSDSTTSANVDDIADMNDDGTPEDSTTHKKQSVKPKTVPPSKSRAPDPTMTTAFSLMMQAFTVHTRAVSRRPYFMTPSTTNQHLPS